MFPADAIREAGLMDSKNYPNFGDAEYTPRLRRLGWNLLIDPRARVFCQPNNIPEKFVGMPIAKKFRKFIFDKGQPHNLRRRFKALWDSAPTKADAVIAFVVFLGRVAVRRNLEGEWGKGRDEKPLRETFRNKTV